MATPVDNPALTAKEEAFVREYLVDLNGAAAARRAGYSEKTSRQAAARNMDKPKIQAAIKAAMDARATSTGITAERVLAELAKVAFANVRDVFTHEGALVPINELPEDVAASLAGVEVVTVQKGEGAVEYVAKVKQADKLRGLELLGKHLGMFQPDLNVTVNVGLADRLAAARARLAGRGK